MNVQTLRRSRWGWLAALACVCVSGWLNASARTATPELPPPTRTLLAKLEHAGRAEASVVQEMADPLGGPPQRRSGRLSLERPDFARLDFREPSESVTLRGDGGEWLQPQLHQMLTFGPAGTGPSTRAWDLLLGRSVHGLTTAAVGPRRWRMRSTGEVKGLPDSVEVTLDSAGLPVSLTAWLDDTQRVSYQMSGWHFSTPKGRAAFVLVAPKGYEIIGTGP